jgi:uncharacterized cupin superfamily protein
MAARWVRNLPSKSLRTYCSGQICCLHDDGQKVTYSAGDAYSIAPGHDAWVVGDDVAVCYEFAGMWGE